MEPGQVADRFGGVTERAPIGLTPGLARGEVFQKESERRGIRTHGGVPAPRYSNVECSGQLSIEADLIAVRRGEPSPSFLGALGQFRDQRPRAVVRVQEEAVGRRGLPGPNGLEGHRSNIAPEGLGEPVPAQVGRRRGDERHARALPGGWEASEEAVVLTGR